VKKDDSSYKYVGPPHYRAEVYTGRVTCCPLVSHREYAAGTDRQTDGRTPDRYIAFSTRRGQRKKYVLGKRWTAQAHTRGQIFIKSVKGMKFIGGGVIA